MNKKLISVIMAVYNTDFYLIKRAIDSVLAQDYPFFELIIVDDGSDNGTEYPLLNYVRQHQDKITYIRHKNRGQSQSINRGILISGGQFITIIDADDEYKVNHLQSCLQEMQHTDLIASTTHTVVNQEADYYVPDRMDHSQVIHVDNCVLFATLFGKKEVFTSVQFLDTYAADAHFYEHVAQTYRVQKVDLRTYIYYRNMPNSICANLKSAYAASLS